MNTKTPAPLWYVRRYNSLIRRLSVHLPYPRMVFRREYRRGHFSQSLRAISSTLQRIEANNVGALHL